tara:strand:+ start:72 stop:437 length:366 start_codon:yes stop_codon:yes gene_type:complete
MKRTETELGHAMLQLARDEVKQNNGNPLPCDRKPVSAVPKSMTNAASIILLELRRNGPSTAQYLGDQLRLTSHKASSTLSSLMNKKIVIQVGRSVDMKDGTYLSGPNKDRHDAWVYQAVSK